MAFAARRTFMGFRGAGGIRRVFASQPQRVSLPGTRPWGHERIPKLNGSGTRGYHGSSSGPNWDGLVYSIMSNIRGKTDYGTECFLSAMDSDLDSESDDKARTQRDIRDLVPLRLNRSALSATARDISIRLQLLCKAEVHTPDYAAVLALIKTVERLAAMPSDNPKLTLQEYADIFMTLRDGFAASVDMPLQTISINEREELKRVGWNAECVWGVAVMNAALRGLEGTKIVETEGEADEERKKTFNGDLRSMAFKINGLLLDSKDFFPEGQRWFTPEQEESILGVVGRVYKEAGKRRSM